MAPNNSPGLGQQSLEVGIERTVDLDARRSIGGAVSLEFWGIEPGDLAEVSSADHLRADPRVVAATLMPSASDRNPRLIDGIAWNAAEYIVVMRSPAALGAAALNRSLSKRQSSGSNEVKTAKAESARRQALEQKISRMLEFKVGLEEEAQRLDEFGDILRARGWWRRKEGDLRIVMAEVWSRFVNMINVAAEHEMWSDEQVDRANMALAAQLLTGPQNKRLQAWGNWRRVCKIYNLQKQRSLRRMTARGLQVLEGTTE